MHKIASFYKFLNLYNYQDLKKPIESFLSENNIIGTILLASEGINGTISGKSKSLDHVLDKLIKYLNLEKIEIKFSFSSSKPFKRLRVKIKKEIVSMGINHTNPQENTGIFVDPLEWNNLINDDSTIIIDTRNLYEVSIGSFSNSI